MTTFASFIQSIVSDGNDYKAFERFAVIYLKHLQIMHNSAERFGFTVDKSLAMNLNRA
jgi:hypothetical protein